MWPGGGGSGRAALASQSGRSTRFGDGLGGGKGLPHGFVLLIEVFLAEGLVGEDEDISFFCFKLFAFLDFGVPEGEEGAAFFAIDAEAFVVEVFFFFPGGEPCGSIAFFFLPVNVLVGDAFGSFDVEDGPGNGFFVVGFALGEGLFAAGEDCQGGQDGQGGGSGWEVRFCRFCHHERPFPRVLIFQFPIDTVFSVGCQASI